MQHRTNEVTELSTFWMPDGRAVTGAKLYSISQLQPTKLGRASIDTLIEKEFRLQQLAVASGQIKPGAELQPKFTREILEDETEKAYTVMALTVPSKENSHSYKVVAMVRPDVVVAEGDYDKKRFTPAYVKLWFTPIVDRAFKGARAMEGNDRNTISSELDTFLIYAAIKRARELKGEDGQPVVSKKPLIFADNQGSMNIGDLRRHGFCVLIDRVGVPDLAATGSALYRPVHRTTLMVKPEGHRWGADYFLPLPMAASMVTDYLHSGFGVPVRAKMVKNAISRLEERAITADGNVYVKLR